MCTATHICIANNNYMKIKFRHIIFFLLTSMFFFNSCKKSVFNYRHKYIGDWKFTNVSNFSSGLTYSTSDTTYDEGEVAYGDNENEIVIGSLTFEIDENAKLSYPNNTNPVGEFLDKKTVTYTMHSYTAGSHLEYIVTGHKK